MPAKSNQIPPVGELADKVSAAVAYLTAHPLATYKELSRALGFSNNNVFSEARRRVGVSTQSARFDLHVDRSGDCWLWTAGTNQQGYGRYKIGGRMESAHRFALERAIGRALCDGEWALHRCDNPPCVRPDHLFVGSRQDNVDDMLVKDRGGDFRGESNGRAKLTDAAVLEIRGLLSTMSVSALSRKYGVSRPVISGIRDGIGWRHLCA